MSRLEQESGCFCLAIQIQAIPFFSQFFGLLNGEVLIKGVSAAN
jgi:hypothetical protein